MSKTKWEELMDDEICVYCEKEKVHGKDYLCKGCREEQEEQWEQYQEEKLNLEEAESLLDLRAVADYLKKEQQEQSI